MSNSPPDADADAGVAEARPDDDDVDVRNQLSWLVPVTIATIGITVLLMMNIEWGASIATIIVLPINVAAAVIPILIAVGVRGGQGKYWTARRRRRWRATTAFSVAALLVTGAVYVLSVEEDPRDYLAGPINIGVRFEQYPGWYVDQGGTRRGFEVDLITALADEFDFDWTPVPLTRAERITALDGSRDIAFVVANFSIDAKREEAIDFAGPYFQDSQGVYGRVDIASALEIPRGKKTCSPEATSALAKLTELEVDPQSAKTLIECFRMYNDGVVDAVSTDALVLESYIAANANAIDGHSVSRKIYTMNSERYGIGIPNGRPRLCQELNKVIQDFLNARWTTSYETNFPDTDLADRNPKTVSECK